VRQILLFFKFFPVVHTQGSHSPGKPAKLLEYCKPGKLLEFYVRPGIFGIIS